MKPGLWHRLDHIARSLVPVLLILGLVIVSVVPTRLPGYGTVAPMLAVIGVCHWSIVRPDLVRPSIAFGIGLFEDILTGTPLGLGAFVLLMVHGVVVAQQRFFLGKSFFVWWWAFGIVAFAAACVKWVGFVAVTGSVADPLTVFLSYALTVFLYPLLGRVFASVEVSLAREG